MTTRGYLRYALVVTASVLGLMLLAACAQGPKPIAYGAAECAYCRMEITDARFGAQVLTPKGRTMDFDSIECLADYVASVPEGGAARAWVSDWEHPGTMLPVTEARLLRVRGPAGSPMGQGLLAVRADADAAALARTLGAQPVEWSELVAAARRARAAGPAGAAEDGDHATRPR